MDETGPRPADAANNSRPTRIPGRIPGRIPHRIPGRKSLLWSLAAPTCAVATLVIVAVAALMPAAVVDAALDDAFMRSTQTAAQMRTLRSFYSEHLIAAAVRSGTKASAAYILMGTSVGIAFAPADGTETGHGVVYQVSLVRQESSVRFARSSGASSVAVATPQIPATNRNVWLAPTVRAVGSRKRPYRGRR